VEKLFKTFFRSGYFALITILIYI